MGVACIDFICNQRCWRTILHRQCEKNCLSKVDPKNVKKYIVWGQIHCRDYETTQTGQRKAWLVLVGNCWGRATSATLNLLKKTLFSLMYSCTFLRTVPVLKLGCCTKYDKEKVWSHGNIIVAVTYLEIFLFRHCLEAYIQKARVPGVLTLVLAENAEPIKFALYLETSRQQCQLSPNHVAQNYDIIAVFKIFSKSAISWNKGRCS